MKIKLIAVITLIYVCLSLLYAAAWQSLANQECYLKEGCHRVDFLTSCFHGFFWVGTLLILIGAIPYISHLIEDMGI